MELARAFQDIESIRTYLPLPTRYLTPISPSIARPDGTGKHPGYLGSNYLGYLAAEATWAECLNYQMLRRRLQDSVINTRHHSS